MKNMKRLSKIVFLFSFLGFLFFSGLPANAFVFKDNLKLSDRGESVYELQKFLNGHGFILAETGVGSIGQETDYFGSLTKQALIKFQKFNAIAPAVGFFGPITRAVVSQKIAAKNIHNFILKSITGSDNKIVPEQNEGAIHTIGGQITGLVSPVNLRNSNGDEIIINPADSSSFSFPVKVATGFNYNVLAYSSNLQQVCYPHLNTGIVRGADVSDIRVACGLNLSYNPFKFVPPSSVSVSSAAAVAPHIPTVSEVGTVADNGATIPLYGSIREAAFYNESLDTTFFAWEAFTDGVRQAQVSSYDHATETFGPIVNSGIPTLISDDHGVPAILQDHQGYGHLFGGAHGADMQHSVADSPNDFTAWTAQTAISGGYSYPHPVLVGSDIYLFMRRSSGGVTTLVLRKTSSLNNGAATWGAEQTIVNLDETPSSNRVYAGNFMAVGTEIWFVAQESPAADTERENVYFFKYDTITGDVLNYDGSATVSSSSLPVDRTQADADFLLYEHQGTDKGTDIPVWFLDGDNRAHVFFGVGPNEGPFDVMYMYDTGAGWSTPEAVATVTGRYDVFAPVLLPSGIIQLYYPAPWHENWSTLDFPLDGEMMLKERAVNGTWSSGQQLVQSEDYSIGRVVPVFNGHADARVMFTELASDRAESLAGGKHLFIYGESGFLSRQEAPTNTSLPIVSGTLLAGETLVSSAGEWSAYPSSLSYAYQWLSDGTEIPGQTNSILSLTQVLASSTITLKVTATNIIGSAIATSSGISSAAWASLTDIPGSPVYNGVPRLVYTGGDYIYSGAVDLSNQFWRYSITNNSWTQMANAPDTFKNYTASVYAGGNYIYVTRGDTTKTFWRYSISGNSWDVMADTQFAIGIGSHAVYGGGDFIYVRQGGTPTVFRYNISTNIWDDWTTIAQAPGNMKWSEITYAGDYLYALQGDNNNVFWRYSIIDNLWSTSTPALGNINAGSTLTYTGGDYLYSFHGNNTASSSRYSITDDAWVSIADAPALVRWGGSMVYANGYIYGRQGNGSSNFWRYRVN